MKCNPKKYQFSFCAQVLCRVSLGEFIVRSIDFIINKNDYAAGAPNDYFRKNICSEDDLSFETFVVKLLACLPLLGFLNI